MADAARSLRRCIVLGSLAVGTDDALSALVTLQTGSEGKAMNQSSSVVLGSMAVCFGAVGVSTTAPASDLPLMWIGDGAETDKPDTYAAFRGRFELAEATEIELHLLGASWFNLWLDETFIAEGPARFHREHPEYDTLRLELPAGRHILAAQVHHIGLSTRILHEMPPFFACRVLKSDRPLSIAWRGSRLAGYTPEVRRINPQLGWIEWCDTRQLPVGWRAPDFDDSAWPEAVPRNPGIGQPRPIRIAPVRSFTHAARLVADGPLAETFGYERDDIPARFFLRDRLCESLPPKGFWRRYDLGRVRLARPRFELDLPSGTVVEFAYSEALTEGRVSPYITLSGGPSCNLDRYIARGGPQEFFPLTPRGGRFVEIHVFADRESVRFNREEFVERCYHDAPEGAFLCGDELLERIWMTGIETYRGCAEDALIDNPTRERGQWTGDVVTVGMDIASAGYSDLRLCRRGLVQSALCAREDGLVAGLCPGGEAYMPSYAAQWVTGCVRYWELTGDRSLLEELFTYAERNLLAFERLVDEEGLHDGLGWTFIDWGYVRNEGPADMAYNLHYLAALRAMQRWSVELDRGDRVEHYRTLEKTITNVVSRWFVTSTAKGESGWREIGYHCAVLGCGLGFFEGEAERDCLTFIKEHMLRSFPNAPDAPRNSDPSLREPRLITPYFAQYSLPLLIERGEMDFVLDQYRTCWGWALEEGRTTWIEVFDTRWTHCHQWAGCPTWQLSRYVLGLHPRYDLGKRNFVLSLQTGSLCHAEGALPLPAEDGVVSVQWTKQADGIQYKIATPVPIVLHIANAEGGEEKRVEIEEQYTRIFAYSPSGSRE